MSDTMTQEKVVAGIGTAWPVGALALGIALVSELIGAVSIKVGAASIIIFPMVWGLLIGVAVSMQRVRPMSLGLQKIANALVGLAVLLLIARLAFNIGPNLRTLFDAGPALLLQEVGHLLGTIALALPLAVLLRMGKATIGATFSLDREPSFAMVREKYGPDSDQFRGVLAMYVFGTLFGAVYITALTSVVVSLKIFSPLALAMGAGVGSGSMMAASVASIANGFPDQEQQILGMAAVSNLITTVLGVYVGIYLALPLADRLYHRLTRRQAPTKVDAAKNKAFREAVADAAKPVHLPLWISLPTVTALGIVTASLAGEGLHWNTIGGYLTLDLLILVSIFLAKVSRRISAIVWLTTLGALVSSPWSPVGEQLANLVSSIPFLSIATIALVCAGLSLGKDVPLLKNIGWKIVPVGLVAITASFLLSTVIAEFALGLWG